MWKKVALLCLGRGDSKLSRGWYQGASRDFGIDVQNAIQLCHHWMQQDSLAQDEQTPFDALGLAWTFPLGKPRASNPARWLKLLCKSTCVLPFTEEGNCLGHSAFVLTQSRSQGDLPCWLMISCCYPYIYHDILDPLVEGFLTSSFAVVR